MPPELTGKDWPRIRHDYEHTGKTVHEICAENGISTGTLRDRIRRWNWTPRRAPVPPEGPPPEAVLPPAPQSETVAPLVPEPSPYIIGPPGLAAKLRVAPPVDARQVARQLQDATARVLTAIDAALASVSAAVHPREIDRAGRTVAGLTRMLHELNTLKAQSPAYDPENDRGPDDPDEFALQILRQLEQFKARKAAAGGGDAA